MSIRTLIAEGASIQEGILDECAADEYIAQVVEKLESAGVDVDPSATIEDLIEYLETPDNSLNEDLQASLKHAGNVLRGVTSRGLKKLPSPVHKAIADYHHRRMQAAVDAGNDEKTKYHYMQKAKYQKWGNRSDWAKKNYQRKTDDEGGDRYGSKKDAERLTDFTRGARQVAATLKDKADTAKAAADKATADKAKEQEIDRWRDFEYSGGKLPVASQDAATGTGTKVSTAKKPGILQKLRAKFSAKKTAPAKPTPAPTPAPKPTSPEDENPPPPKGGGGGTVNMRARR